MQATASPPLPAFSTIDGALTTESSTLGALSTTAGATVTFGAPAGTLVLTGTNTQENVFDLTAGELAGTADLYINVPAGSSTVINVPDTTVNCSTAACLQIVYFWDGSVYEAGNSAPSPAVQYLVANTVLNFPDATSVQLSAAVAQPQHPGPPGELRVQERQHIWLHLCQPGERDVRERARADGDDPPDDDQHQLDHHQLEHHQLEHDQLQHDQLQHDQLQHD